MIKPQLTQPQWLALPADVKAQLKVAFGVPRSEGARVDDNKVISDGHNHNDLAVITLERMQDFLGFSQESDEFYETFDRVLDKLNAQNVYAQPAAVESINPEMVFTFNGKMYRAVEMTPGTPTFESVPTLYPNAPSQAVAKEAEKPKATRAPRKKGKK